MLFNFIYPYTCICLLHSNIYISYQTHHIMHKATTKQYDIAQSTTLSQQVATCLCSMDASQFMMQVCYILCNILVTVNWLTVNLLSLNYIPCMYLWFRRCIEWVSLGGCKQLQVSASSYIHINLIVWTIDRCLLLNLFIITITYTLWPIASTKSLVVNYINYGIMWSV